MKQLNLCLLLLLGISFAQAQDFEDSNSDREYNRNEIKTVMGRNSRVTGFGSLDLKITEVKDQLVLMPGFTAGMIMNRNFILGIGGYGIATEVDFQGVVNPNELYLYGGYGGLLVGAVIAPKEIIHVYFPVLIGAGGAYITEEGFRDFGQYSNEYDEASAFFVVEPGVEIEINFTNFFRMGIGGSYRYVKYSDLDNITDAQLSNYSGHISLKFGKFR